MVGDGGMKVEGDDENSEQIDGELVPSIRNPIGIQYELEKLHVGFFKVDKKFGNYPSSLGPVCWSPVMKFLDIDQKHNETRKPVYDKRNEIIQSIPDFWLIVFLSHPMLAELLTDEDRKILKYLDSLDVEDSKDVKSGYSITFGLPNGAAREKKGNKGPLSGESFFHWFSDAQHKDVAAEIHDEIADIIKELWANSPTLFNNVDFSFPFVAPCEGRRAWGTTSYNQVSEEETALAFVYKMDRPWLRPDQVRVEIPWGHALWVIGQGEEPVKVELPRIDKMRVSEAMASMNADSVLTVVIPKRHGPQKWHEYKDLVFAWFKTVRVGVSS